MKAQTAIDLASNLIQPQIARPSWLAKAREIFARASSPASKPIEFVAAKKTAPAKLYIYDKIGKDPWDGSGIDPSDVVKALDEANGADLEIHINSPGGQVFAGIAIFNTIRAYAGKKTVCVDSLAASIASVIALAGDTVTTAEGALWMIHDPMGGVYVLGTAEEIEKSCNQACTALRKIRDDIIGLYASKTGRSVSELSAWMGDETWMTAEEAKARGFTDTVAKSETTEPEEEPAEARSAVQPRAKTVEEILATARADWNAIRSRFAGASPGAQHTGQPVTPKTTK